MISPQQSIAMHCEVKEHRGSEKRHLPPEGRAVIALAGLLGYQCDAGKNHDDDTEHEIVFGLHIYCFC